MLMVNYGRSDNCQRPVYYKLQVCNALQKTVEKKSWHLLSLFGSETSGRESQILENQNMIFMLSVENKILP